MGVTKIEWTGSLLPDGSMSPGFTFNPWWGCTKVSAGCKHCYAEKLDSRFKGNHWGPTATRKSMSEAYWKQPLKWNADAGKAGVRAKVFCASMADVFEGPDTCQDAESWAIIEAARLRLWGLIAATPNLDWLLLTKRPEKVMPILNLHLDNWTGPDPDGGDAPANVWLGTSVNDCNDLHRINYLCTVPATVRFLSIEPLLENIGTLNLIGIDWVIVGGESGPNARPMNPNWARSIRDQCQDADIPFFFKQWGEWAVTGKSYTIDLGPGMHGPAFSPFDAKDKGSYYVRLDEPGKYDHVERVGKHAAGRLLDGREWNEFPEAKR